MDEPVVMSNEELRRRISRYRGKGGNGKVSVRPTPADKSTTFCMNDILLLAKINNRKRFYDFVMGRTTFGPIVRAKLTKVVITLDGGFATKSQYGVYHFYDKPVAPARREMTISFGNGGIRLGAQMRQESSPKLPEFMEIFKGN